MGPDEEIVVPDEVDEDYSPPGYVQPDEDDVYVGEVHTEHEGLPDGE